MGLYFRLKNNDIVLKAEGVDVSYLVINETSLDDAGIYMCRANNDISAIKSEPAVLQIKGRNSIQISRHLLIYIEYCCASLKFFES